MSDNLIYSHCLCIHFWRRIRPFRFSKINITDVSDYVLIYFINQFMKSPLLKFIKPRELKQLFQFQRIHKLQTSLPERHAFYDSLNRRTRLSSVLYFTSMRSDVALFSCHEFYFISIRSRHGGLRWYHCHRSSEYPLCWFICASPCFFCFLFSFV